MSKRFSEADLLDLAAHITGVDLEAAGEEYESQIEDKLCEKYSISFIEFCELFNDVTPLLSLAVTPLTGTPYIGYADLENDVWLAKVDLGKSELIGAMVQFMTHLEYPEPFTKSTREIRVDGKPIYRITLEKIDPS